MILNPVQSFIRHREAALAAVAIQSGLHSVCVCSSRIAAGLKPLAMTARMKRSTGCGMRPDQVDCFS